jgi:hypothetical protein
MVEMVMEAAAPCSPSAPSLNTSTHHWAGSHSTRHRAHIAAMHHHRSRAATMPATAPTTATTDATGTRKTASAHTTTTATAAVTTTASASPALSGHGG